MRKLVLISLFLFLSAKSVWAVTIYADNTIGPSMCTNYIVTGAGARTCGTGGTATAYKDISPAAQALNSGDVLLIRGGTYTTFSSTTAVIFGNINGGTNFTNATRIEAYPGGCTGRPPNMVGCENAIIKPATGITRIIYPYGSNAHHIIFNGLVLDGSNMT